LNEDFAGPILETAKLFSITHDHIRYVREVVYAVSALGGGGVQQASQVDAAYGDVLIDIGGLVDISGERGGENSTARVAHRFGEVMQSEMKLMDAEMIHFYVRELYKRLNVAA